MKWIRFLLCCLIISALLQPTLAQAQALPAGDAQNSNQAPEMQSRLPTKLSPGAEEVAKEIGVLPLIEQLYRLPERDRAVGGGVMGLEALTLRQEISETVIRISLEIDGVIAEIDEETSQISEVRAYLEARRDRALAISSVANIVAGGATGVVGTALQFKESTTNLGNAIGVVGGGISTFLSFIGLRQQRGGQHPLGRTPNMLAKIFDRSPEFHSEYPAEVWVYLNTVPPTETGTGTRKEQLIKEWIETGHIEKPETTKGQRKIELMTSGVAEQHGLTIDLLTDRAAMLANVRARVSLMKRDLSKLMLALSAR